VRNAAVNPSNVDARLTHLQNAALSTYGSEGVAADGGFAVPPEWRDTIMKQVDSEDSLLSSTDQQPVTGNSITFPVDETTAWQTTGGILAYWDGEAAAMTQSKPALKDVTIKLHRITALVPVTDELLADTAALGSYVAGKAGEKIDFKVNDAIINGTGAGMPLGILNAPALVSVAKETSQTGATIHGRNVVKMMARMPAQSYKRAMWLINQDCVPQVLALGLEVTKADGTAAGAGAIYLPPNGLANSSPYGSLLGRPIFVTEACQTLGTKGDIFLADMQKYLAAVKAGGVRSDTSIHLYFDQNVTAFRFVLRMNGQPWLSAPIARKNGSNTLSHFISLDTRT
jgi:HK97 family phage major capsid protein